MVKLYSLYLVASTLISDRLEALENSKRDDRGEIVTWIIVAGLTAAAAIIIVATVVTKLKGTATNLKTS